MSVQLFCHKCHPENRFFQSSERWAVGKISQGTSATSSEGRVQFDGSTTPVVLESSRPADWTCDNDGLRCARAVFTKHDSVGKVRVILSLHVDHGLRVGDGSDPVSQKIKLISEQIDIKRWRDLDDPKRVNYLVLPWKRVLEGIQADMHKYMNKLEPIVVPTPADIKDDKSSRDVLASVFGRSCGRG